MTTYTIDTATGVDDSLVDALARLIPQLSSSAAPITPEVLSTVIGHEACHLLVATDDDTGEILGALTLAVFPIPTGVRAWIEDVVVDEATRGRGVGAALNERALELAAELGAKTVDLTSRPSREPANRLYVRLGFDQRHTNVYRYDLSTGSQ